MGLAELGGRLYVHGGRAADGAPRRNHIRGGHIIKYGRAADDDADDDSCDRMVKMWRSTGQIKKEALATTPL